ncbi:hypothetical protein Tco_1351904 [Tanacetum coccineum]
MGELNTSAMEVEGLMSQVSTSIPADDVRSKASDLSTINGDTSEFAGSLNIQVGANKLVDANVANVVTNNDHVACEKKVEEVKGFKGLLSAANNVLMVDSITFVQKMVNILVSGKEYDKVFNHLDMLNAPLEGKWHGMEQVKFKGDFKLRGRLFHSWKI